MHISGFHILNSCVTMQVFKLVLGFYKENMHQLNMCWKFNYNNQGLSFDSDITSFSKHKSANQSWRRNESLSFS